MNEITISLEAGEVSLVYETGDAQSPWGTLPPKSGGGATHIQGMKSVSLPGTVSPEENLAESSESSGSGIIIASETMKPNPNSVIRRTSNRQDKSWGKVTIDPNVRGGVPCVQNGRWAISHILEKLADGTTPDDLVQNHHDLTLADIQLALDASAWVMRDPAIDWSLINLPGMVEFQHEMQAWEGLSDDALGLVETSSGD